jgi:hypothetical protein
MCKVKNMPGAIFTADVGDRNDLARLHIGAEGYRARGSFAT